VYHASCKLASDYDAFISNNSSPSTPFGSNNNLEMAHEEILVNEVAHSSGTHASTGRKRVKKDRASAYGTDCYKKTEMQLKKANIRVECIANAYSECRNSHQEIWGHRHQEAN